MKNCPHREGCDPTKSERTPIKNKAGVEVDAHDCNYVDARNRLIPHAEAEARRVVYGNGIVGSANDMAFSRAFSAAMDRLAVEAGLTQPTPTMLAQRARAAA